MSIRAPLSDWTLVQTFLAVADTGSYSGAARNLGRSQPTVGRQIEALEAGLGTPLFRRHPKGMALTDAGAGLVEPARKMQEAAGQIALLAAGQSETLAGTVRITASAVVAHHILPSVIARIRRELPEVTVDLVASDRADNLLFREADIAVRMFRPDQLDIVTRHIGDMPIGLYAAKAYLDRVGRPTGLGDLQALDFVGEDRNDQIIRGFRAQNIDIDRDFFMVRCDDQTAIWELVRAGCGLGFGQRFIGDADPLLERVEISLDLPILPMWLASHEAMRRTPRIRRVWDILADALRAVLP